MRLLLLVLPALAQPPALQLRAETQPWAPALARLLADVGAAAPLRKDAPLTPRTGTAFWTPDGLTTAGHTVAGATKISILADAAEHPARLTFFDPQRDLGRLQVALAPGAAPLATWTAGQPVRVPGFPADGPLQVATGAVVGVETLAFTGAAREWLRLDVPVRPGQSGAPVLDVDGAVIGMVVAGHRTQGRDEGPAIALPAEDLRDPPSPPEPRLEIGAAPDLTWRELALSADGEGWVVLSAPARLRPLGWWPGRRVVRVAGGAVPVGDRAALEALTGAVLVEVESGALLLLP